MTNNGQTVAPSPPSADGAAQAGEEAALAAKFAAVLRMGEPDALALQLAKTFMEVRGARTAMAKVREEHSALKGEVAQLRAEVKKLRAAAPQPRGATASAESALGSFEAAAGSALGMLGDLAKGGNSTREFKRGNTVLGSQHCGKELADDFEVGEVLGEGSFGIARRATCKQTGGVFACKSISKQKLQSAQAVSDVRREVSIMHHLAGHPNIVRLEGTYEDSNDVHLILELCSGGDLFERLVSRKGAYTERRAATLIRTMLQVVAHCHTMGVVHRDLKPDNFLLTDSSDNAKLKCTDFGLSAFFEPDAPLHDVVGTPFYVAPEVLAGNYGPQSDIWSCGVILYILLTGRAPFFGDANPAIFEQIQHAPAGKNLAWPAGSDVSPAAKDAVQQMLERDVRARAGAEEILRHEWLRENGVASDRPLDHALVSRIRGFAAMNRLKKQALKIIAGFLPEAEIRGLRKLFRQIDADGTGMITVSELQLALRTKGTIIPEDELQAILLASDVDGNGKLDYREFLAATIHLSKMEREDLLYRAFHELDQDKSGFITRAELAHVLGDLRVGEVDKVMKEVDVNGDGRIDYREFCTLMRSPHKTARTEMQADEGVKSLVAMNMRNPDILLMSSVCDDMAQTRLSPEDTYDEELISKIRQGASFSLALAREGSRQLQPSRSTSVRGAI